MSRKGATPLPKDVPWRQTSGPKPIPRIHHSPVLSISQTPLSNYAAEIMKNPDPVGNGMAMDAILDSAGPECIVPGQATPVKLLGLKVWPIDVDTTVLNRIGREFGLVGRVMDSAVKTMDKVFID